jgi:thioester reductase-like protein
MTADQSLSSDEKRSLLVKLMQNRLRKYAPMLSPESDPKGLERFSISSAELKFETALDPSITLDASLAEGAAEPSSVLLTGATGFLGAFLLDGLLKRTQARVYCLVRASHVEEGRQRIYKTLQSYIPEDGWRTCRIIPVPGDLTKPLFGLSPTDFEKLAASVDCVYHNGAMVHGLYSYTQLKPANVEGTQEAIRLAGLGRLKPLHYVSTLAACPLEVSSEVKVVREAAFDYDGVLYGGYPQSKWVAEQLVLRARANGLPVAVYRPGIITGHSQTGAWNTSDATCRMIKVTVESGIFPDTEAAVDMTPVDYVSQAIVYLATSGHALGQIYHLANPKPLNWGDLVSWLRSYGYPVRRTPYEEWRSEMVALAQRLDKNPLSPLMPLFGVALSNKVSGWMASMISSGYQRGIDRVITALLSRYGERSLQFDCKNAQRDLAGAQIACPAVDDTLLYTYLSNFVRIGYLHAPA